MSGHGMTGTRTWRIWRGMRYRCRADRPHYEGVSVCARWDSFELFLEDMGPCPSSNHSIDRRDVSGDYEPGNCRWATPAVQAANRSTSFRFVIDGREMCIREWANEFGVNYNTAKGRIRRGWPPELAVTTKP